MIGSTGPLAGLSWPCRESGPAETANRPSLPRTSGQAENGDKPRLGGLSCGTSSVGILPLLRLGDLSGLFFILFFVFCSVRISPLVIDHRLYFFYPCESGVASHISPLGL